MECGGGKMKQRFQFHMGVGTISLLMIFVVLCMVILSSLSFLNAKASRDLAMREKAEITSYYTADAAGVLLYQQFQPLSTIDANYDKIVGLDIVKQNNIIVTRDETSILMEIPMDYKKQLQIRIQEDGTIVLWGVHQEQGEDI